MTEVAALLVNCLKQQFRKLHWPAARLVPRLVVWRYPSKMMSLKSQPVADPLLTVTIVTAEPLAVHVGREPSPRVVV